MSLVSDNIIEGIWKDLCNRKGYDLGCLDDEIRKEIVDSWDKIIKEVFSWSNNKNEVGRMQQIMQAEMKPDIYGGKNADQHTPRWNVYAEGDPESSFLDGEIAMKPEAFTPGTIVVAYAPMCPECDMIQGLCGCGFDWKKWADNKYV